MFNTILADTFLSKFAQKKKLEIIYAEEGAYEEQWMNIGAEECFQNSGIRMLNADQHFSIMADVENEEVYGTIVYHDSDMEEDDLGEMVPSVYFSVAVPQSKRGAGVASKLISDFVSSMYSTVIKAEVWNPFLYDLLERLRFEEVEDLTTNENHPIKLYVRQ